MSQFQLLVYDLQSTPVFRGDLAAGGEGLYPAQHVSISNILPGGNEACSFRLPISGSPWAMPAILGKFYELRVLDAESIFWIGRMEDFKLHIGRDGMYWDVTAYGYGVNLDDQAYTAQNVAGVATGTIADNAITNLTQKIGARSVTATSVSISAATAVNLKLLKASVVVNWAAKFGDSAFNPQIWYVYPDADATVRFTFKDRPATPDLYISAQDMDLLDFGLLGRQLGNRVIVQYNDGASAVTRNNTALQGAGPNGWNFIKAVNVFAPEITQSADANQLGDAVLQKVQTTYMFASNVSLRPNARIVDSNGQLVKPWRVKAGQLVQLTDIIPAEGALTNLTFNNSFLVARVAWDEDRQALSLTPESQEPTIYSIVAQAKSVLAGRHTVQAR